MMKGKRKRSSSGDFAFTSGSGSCSSSGCDRDLSEILIEAKKALHTSHPTSLPCREVQIEELYQFLSINIAQQRPGSIYISGSPGTGKTAVVHHVIDRLQKGTRCKTVFINCMNVVGLSSSSPCQLLREISEKIESKGKGQAGDVKDRIVRRLQSKIGRPVLLILDEVDQLALDRKFKDLLHLIHDWTRLPGSRLLLVGIANTLDLTLTGHLKSPNNGQGQAQGQGSSVSSPISNGWNVMQFPPYDKAAIESILEFRLKQVLTSTVFEAMAVKFIAAKVAATTGDMRKALNACQAALDTNGPGNNSHSQKIHIGVGTISKILTTNSSQDSTDLIFPLQQKLLVGTMLKIHKENQERILSVNCDKQSLNQNSSSSSSSSESIPSARLYEVYRRVCDRLGFSWIDRSELPSICAILEDRGILRLNNGTGKQLKKSNSFKGSFRKSKQMSVNQNFMNFSVTFQVQDIESLLKNDFVLASIIN